MKNIIYQTQFGVAVVIPTGEVSIDQVIANDVPPGVPYKLVDQDSLPDRYFRLAWRFNTDAGVKIDISTSKEIQRDKFRIARKPLLAALDVEFMRAVESGDSIRQSEIASQKQALRDVTTIELPDTLEGIKATWPSILGARPF